MSPTPTLLFCAGTVKSGTSWLHAYLRDHPEAHMRTVKETNFFTSLYGDWRRLRLRKLDEEIAAMAENLASGKSEPNAYNLRQMKDRQDYRLVMTERKAPVQAFLTYLTAGAGERKLAGEMTPEYGLLEVENMRKINALAPDVRWVVLLRDPVSRLWSHVRMLVKRAKPAPEAFAAACAAKFDDVLAGRAPDVTERGDYAAILDRLFAAVAPEKRLVAIYERLMSQGGVDEVTRFLGLSSHPARLDRVVHGGIALDMPEGLRVRAREWLRPQYDYVARLMGLPPEWESFPEFRSEVA